MDLLLDTHLLLWIAAEPKKLSDSAKSLISDSENRLFFSAASLWEVVIKNSLDRWDFKVDASLLRRGLVENSYDELPILARHTLSVGHLPLLHKDPFDRILLAQAETEGILLLTNDAVVAQYQCPVRLV